MVITTRVSRSTNTILNDETNTKSLKEYGKDAENKKESQTITAQVRKSGIVQGYSKMVPLQELKKSQGVKGFRQSSMNNEIRKVTSRKDLWQRSQMIGTCKKTRLDDAKVIEGRRSVLRMPASIPKPHKKQRYKITVVGNEIKLVDPKCRSLRMTDTIASPFRRISPTCGTTQGHIIIRRRKKTRISRRHKKAIKDTDADFLQKNLDRGDGAGVEFDRPGMSATVSTSEPVNCEVPRKIYKFSDRRTKCETPDKSIQICTGEELLLERLDPISNILSTELLDSVKRCESIIDFVTAPIENPYPPLIMKQIFYDTTVMEELNFPPIATANISSNKVPELKLVPRFSCKQKSMVSKSQSVPNLSTSSSYLRPFNVSGRKRKKKPKIETILATRPRGFQHAKWLEKTVGSDSTLKSKLLQDVIISQVKKCLRKQAELKQKLLANSELTDIATNKSSKTLEDIHN